MEVYVSKLYMKYLKKKNEDNDKYYLFRSGMFYIFLQDDAINISNKVGLKLTRLNDEVVKCGFPSNSLDKYLKIFSSMNIDIKVIDDDRDVCKRIIKMIRDIDIDNISPVKSLEILDKFKRLLDE